MEAGGSRVQDHFRLHNKLKPARGREGGEGEKEKENGEGVGIDLKFTMLSKIIQIQKDIFFLTHAVLQYLDLFLKGRCDGLN